ncbi:MAG: 1-(5-phosphoribosyl)-5-[(5-phosphoribosylamino)methylideneamino]imidazole-4-carboxamide isomerase [Chloroflexota bacterium]
MARTCGSAPASRSPDIELIPAVDLRAGKCVRLYQGDYGRETVFSEQPVDMALHWQSMGAPRLHIVDLDGASQGRVCHWEVIAEIARRTTVPLQVGGGIRDLPAIEKLLSVGVERAILGTSAVEAPTLVGTACSKFGDRIVVSVDDRSGLVATHGWRKPTQVGVVEMIESMAVLGVRRIIYTDITRDGTLERPDFVGIGELVPRVSLPIIVAGGISSLDDLLHLREMGVEGAIIGQALYAGRIDLKKALEVLGDVR